VAGNTDDGVVILNATTTGNIILGNIIGRNAANSAALANGGDGIQVSSSAVTATIGGTAAGAGNTISGNTGIGVSIASGSTGVTIEGNSIYGNGGLGIDLNNNGVTANDAAPDSDTGANNLQNYPVLSSASSGQRQHHYRWQLDQREQQRLSRGILREHHRRCNQRRGRALPGLHHSHDERIGHRCFHGQPERLAHCRASGRLCDRDRCNREHIGICREYHRNDYQRSAGAVRCEQSDDDQRGSRRRCGHTRVGADFGQGHRCGQRRADRDRGDGGGKHERLLGVHDQQRRSLDRVRDPFRSSRAASKG
jgi:hypothetical protein